MVLHPCVSFWQLVILVTRLICWIRHIVANTPMEFTKFEKCGVNLVGVLNRNEACTYSIDNLKDPDIFEALRLGSSLLCVNKPNLDRVLKHTINELSLFFSLSAVALVD